MQGDALGGQQVDEVRDVHPNRRSASRTAQALRDLGGVATSHQIAKLTQQTPSLVSAKLSNLAKAGVVVKDGEVVTTVRRFERDVQVKVALWRIA